MNIESIEYLSWILFLFYYPFFSTKLNYHIGEKRIAIERKEERIKWL